MKTATTAMAVALTVVRVTGLVQIVTGLLFWTGNALVLLPVHLLSGMVLVLALWALAILAARAGVGAGRAALAGLWGALVVGLGLTQSQLLPGDAHWVVQVLHLLVGLGAMSLAQNLATRTRRGGAAREPRRARQPSTRRPSGPRMRAAARRKSVNPSRSSVTPRARSSPRSSTVRPKTGRTKRSAPPPSSLCSSTSSANRRCPLARTASRWPCLGHRRGQTCKLRRSRRSRSAARETRSPARSTSQSRLGGPTSSTAVSTPPVLAAGRLTSHPSPLRSEEVKGAASAASNALAEAVWGADWSRRPASGPVVVG